MGNDREKEGGPHAGWGDVTRLPLQGLDVGCGIGGMHGGGELGEQKEAL